MRKYSTILILILVFSIVVIFVSSCSNSNKDKEYFYQTDIDGIAEYMEGDKDGFVLVVTENNDYFVDDVKKAANEKKVEVAMYNWYQPGGVDTKAVKNPTLEYDLTRASTLYYIVDNEVVDDIKLNNYADSQLTQEVFNFITQ